MNLLSNANSYSIETVSIGIGLLAHSFTSWKCYEMKKNNILKLSILFCAFSVYIYISMHIWRMFCFLLFQYGYGRTTPSWSTGERIYTCASDRSWRRFAIHTWRLGSASVPDRDRTAIHRTYVKAGLGVCNCSLYFGTVDDLFFGIPKIWSSGFGHLSSW